MKKMIFAMFLAITMLARSSSGQISGSVTGGPVVTTLNDGGQGSLRLAVLDSISGGTIKFATNLSGQLILLTNGLIDLNKNLTIDASALSNGIQISGNQNSQIFQVEGGTTVILDSLTLTNGYSANGVGGAIFSEGNLTLNNCELVNNFCGGTGGALASVFGSLAMNQTLVSDNVCVNCSALYIQDEPATLVGCTISGNQGNEGDALRLQAGSGNPTLVVINSTFSGNVTRDSVGGAITVSSGAGLSATAYLTNCTVANNMVTQAGQPAAIFIQPSGGTNSVTLYNTIVSGNTSGGAPGDITGTLASGSSYNLIGAGGGLANGVNGNLVGITNPLLATLGNYGGTTQTMPPIPGSPAIDAGGFTTLTNDQRGLPRPVGAAADIGSVESQVCTGSVTVNSATVNEGDAATLTATNTASGPIYLWSDGETTQSIIVSPDSTTNYTVQVFDSTTACIATGSATVTVIPDVVAQVTFQVDMSAEILAGQFNPVLDYVSVGGSFNGWSTGMVFTNDPGATNPNLYSAAITITNVPGTTNYYKFVADGGDDLGWEQPVSTGGNNRTFVFNPTDNQQILPPVYFSDLSPSEIVVSNTLVTFTVDMTGAVGNEGHIFDSTNDSVYLNGNFLDWWSWGEPPATALLTNVPGTDLYTLTLTVSAGSPRMLVYNYGINGFDDEPGSPQSHVRYIPGSGNVILQTDIFGMPLAEPLITWPTPTAIIYGTPLGSDQLNASANVPGTFVYSPAAGAVLNAGKQTLSAIFIPDAGSNYYTMTNTLSLVVLPAPLTLTVSNATRVFGQPNPLFTGSILGLQNGDIITAIFSCNAGLTSLPGNYPIVPVLMDPGNRLTNYQVTTNSGFLTITYGNQVLAHDDASAYFSLSNNVVTGGLANGNVSPNGSGSGTWTSGQNFGYGFLPWNIQTNGFASQGAFIGDGGNIATANNSAWGLYAYGQPLTNTVVAYRGLSNSLPVGLALKLEWRSGYIGTNDYNFAGFSLRSGNASSSTADLQTGEEMAFFYRGAGSTVNPMDNVIIRDGTGENYAPAPGVNFASLHAGVAVEITLLSSNTYRLVVLDAATSNTIAVFDNRTLEGGGTIDSLALFDNQTDPLGGEYDGNQLYNNLEISVPSTPVLPAVVVSPANLDVAIGGTGIFNAITTGTPPFAYQWEFNGRNISGANSAELTLSNVQVGNGGQYRVVVTSPFGAVISPAAKLSLVTPTTILVPPADAEVVVGGTASFSVIALSSGPLTYQWIFAGVAIPGATNSSYQVSNAQLTNEGNYTVQITNSAGSVTSASAALEVVPAPAPIIPTLSYTINIQTGTNLIANQLDQGGDTLYDIMPVVPDGTVVDKFDNTNGVWMSSAYNAALGAWIPSSIALRPGEGAEMISPTNFSLTFTGTPHVPSLPLNIPNGTAWLVSRQTNDVGTYENIVGAPPAPGAVIFQWNPTKGNYTQYTFSSDGWSGGVEPTAAIGESLWIGPTGGSPVEIPMPPTISQQPTGLAVAQGGSATFTVSATGSEPLTYQWQLDGNAIPDATNPVYNIPDVQTLNAGNYSVVIINPIGVTNSATVALTIPGNGTLPVADDFANAGTIGNSMNGLGTASNIGATTEPGEPGPGTIIFGSSVWIQWQPPQDGIASLTTVGSSYDTVLGVFTGSQLTNLQLIAADDDSGPDLTSALTFNAVGGNTYYIQISGFHGEQGNILLAWNLTPTINTTPVIVIQPQGQTQTNSGPVNLSVFVTNTFPGVSYQWSLNGTPLPGATNNVYAIANLTPAEVGLYTVGITNLESLAGVASFPASVEIFDPGLDQPGNFANIHPQDKFFNAAALTPHDPNIPNDPSFAGGYTGTQAYSSVGATADIGEPDHCGYTPCHSIWYSYVPPSSGLLTMTTTNDFNAILEVYTGPATSFATLIPLACSANHGTNGESIALSVLGGSNYWVVVDGVDCASGNFTLGYALSSPPVFASLPVGQTVTNGSTITLLASTTGTPPFFYQWKFQGTNMLSATNSSLVISNFQAFNQGEYSVTTWNPSGTNVSAAASLYLSSPPRFVSFGVISGAVSAQFVGMANTNYVFQASSNLVNWQIMTTNSSPVGIFNFYDHAPPGLSGRFYRAVSQ
jgi:hypothetical protein